ncbi:MAG: hypothetical protein HYW49_02280 [Deltaproteobacteria bacterium]|nr:hypothetical protein [Deltaproteobacteria bacterium]
MSVRFAPSPTGVFHLGNLRTAWVSHAWARALGLPWFVRFEDIDAPRSIPGAREKQLEDMARLGLVPDRMSLQSAQRARHWELFQAIVIERGAYPCVCSRKDLREALDQLASAPHAPHAVRRQEPEPPVYHGRCRGRVLTAADQGALPTVAWRMKGAAEDGSQDMIIARTAKLTPDETSFTPAYQWACAIDDSDGGFPLLVRAWDLESSARPQRAIQAWLASRENREAKFPAIFHASLLIGNDGSRLEKRTRGITLDELFAAGWTKQKILDRFEKSFTPVLSDFAPAKLWGEPRREITLKELGF